MYRYSDIKHVHLEISTRCNAACPGCPRNLCGVDVIDDFPLHDMRLDEAKKIFTPEFVKQLREIQINGNLGDFITARDGLEIVRYFRECNPRLKIDISTNAGIKSDMWEELAKLRPIVRFCLDGMEGTHELYRQQTRWSTVIANAEKFINAGGNAIWKFVEFDHNRDQLEECKALSKSMGFRDFEVAFDGRNAFPVFDQKGRFKHNIGKHSLSTDFEQLVKYHFDTQSGFIPIYETKKISCEVQNYSSVYIAANGEVYPCCYLGFYPGRMSHPGNNVIAPLVANNNAIEVGMETAIEWFNTVERTWSTDDQLWQCKNYCGS